MKKILGTLIIIILLYGFSSYTPQYKNIVSPLFQLQYDKEAYDVLCKAWAFSDSATGYGGEMSEAIKAYSKLYKSHNAKDVFKHLEKDANMQGKLYALCAYYYLDNIYYHERIKYYIKSDEEVKLQYGCIGFSDKVSSVIKNEDGNDDFIGGGIPATLKDYIAHVNNSDLK